MEVIGICIECKFPASKFRCFHMEVIGCIDLSWESTLKINSLSHPWSDFTTSITTYGWWVCQSEQVGFELAPKTGDGLF